MWKRLVSTGLIYGGWWWWESASKYRLVCVILQDEGSKIKNHTRNRQIEKYERYLSTRQHISEFKILTSERHEWKINRVINDRSIISTNTVDKIGYCTLEIFNYKEKLNILTKEILQ